MLLCLSFRQSMSVQKKALSSALRTHRFLQDSGCLAIAQSLFAISIERSSLLPPPPLS